MRTQPLSEDELDEIRSYIIGVVRPPLDDFDWEGVAADLLSHITEITQQRDTALDLLASATSSFEKLAALTSTPHVVMPHSSDIHTLLARHAERQYHHGTR